MSVLPEHPDLAQAREVDQPSWAALVREIEARNTSIPETDRLLLDRGAPVRSETVVASLYAAAGTWCLELLLAYTSSAPELLTDALVEAAAEPGLDAVSVLLAAGADLDVRDSRWQGRPLEWALVGSGEELSDILP